MMFSRALFKPLLVVVALAVPAMAQDDPRRFRLSAPEELGDTGILKFLLPRFSLKHGVRIEVVAPGDDAEARLSAGPPGQPVFEGPVSLWYLQLAASDHDGAQRFSEWLASDIGVRTIEGFTRDGETLFSVPVLAAEVEEELVIEGDPLRGEKIARTHCSRCHVVNENERMNAIGSTPSFFALRTFEDWDARFAGFYALNPHPAFTQIDGLTEPFDPMRPPPIVPLVISDSELEHLLAFVAILPPADLGAPVQHQ